MSGLATTVYITDDEGTAHRFDAGTDRGALPGWAQKKTADNPLLWEGESAVEPLLSEIPDHRPGTPDPGAGVAPPVPGSEPEGEGEGPPPQSGAGSSRQAWAEYAEANGVDVQDDWKRDDIIAACEKAGVAV